MHELSIALGILDIAAEEIERRGAARATAIHLKLGRNSGVVKEALLSAYEIASQTCDMADCRLVIEDVPMTIYCPACRGARPVVSIQESRCNQCGTPSSQTLTGLELEVTAMEIIE